MVLHSQRRKLLTTGLVVLAGISIYRYTEHRSTQNMSKLSIVRAANAAFAPTYLPVAVFVGGTSGIGQGIAEAFARHTKGNAHILIVGRNKAAAERIINGFPKPTIPEAKHEFIECDATLMRNVHSSSKEILKRLEPSGKINFLVMSPGFMSTSGREETVEGLDKKLAVHYYARWKFTQELLPALKKAKEDLGEDGEMFSVLGAGKGGKIDLDDLGLKKHYSTAAAGTTAVTYNDLMVEEFAAQNPSLSFAHAFPGMVQTNLLSSSPSRLLRASNFLTKAFSPLMTSPEDAGEYLLYGILTTANKSGSWRIGEHGQDIGKQGYFGSEEARRKVWEHTVEATKID